ncbi:hypothetical protein V6N13_051384 [Hibiscus sabdariffa]
MTPLPSSVYRARILWSGLCIARQVRALAMPSRWGEFVTPTRPTTRGFGHVDARSRWLYATRLDNVTPNTDFIMPSGCGVPSLIVASAPRPNLSVVWVVDRWEWMLLLVRNGHVSGEMVVCVSRLRASCIELSSRTPLQCPPLLAVEPKGCDRDPVLLVPGAPSVSIDMIRLRRCIDARSCFRMRNISCSGPHARYTDVFNESIALAERLGESLKFHRDGDRSLQLLVFNKEFLVSASHQLALTTSLPFVHTARRSYRLNGPVKCSDRGDVGGSLPATLREVH